MKKGSLVIVQGHQKCSSPGSTQTVTKINETRLSNTTRDEPHPRTKTIELNLSTPEKRRPLTPIQTNKGISENIWLSSSSKEKATLGVRSIVNTKVTDFEKSVENTSSNPDSIVTSEVPTLDYWKQLEEARRDALEETLDENKKLMERIESLEAENSSLNELLEDAKELAEMVNNISEDAEGDESGIIKDDVEQSN